MSTHNIGLYEDLTKIIIKYQIRTLSSSSGGWSVESVVSIASCEEVGTMPSA